MDIVEEGRKAILEYESTGLIPNLPPNMTSNDFDVWLCCFEKYPEVWKIYAIKSEIFAASQALQIYKKDPSIIKIVSMEANIRLTFYLDSRSDKWAEIYQDMQEQTVKIWLKTFQDTQLLQNWQLVNDELTRNFSPQKAEKIDKLLVFVAELADASDLKSEAPQGACGFESHQGHL